MSDTTAPVEIWLAFPILVSTGFLVMVLPVLGWWELAAGLVAGALIGKYLTYVLLRLMEWRLEAPVGGDE